MLLRLLTGIELRYDKRDLPSSLTSLLLIKTRTPSFPTIPKDPFESCMDGTVFKRSDVSLPFKSAFPLTLVAKKPYSVIHNFNGDSIVIMMATDIVNADYLDFYKHNRQLLKEN